MISNSQHKSLFVYFCLTISLCLEEDDCIVNDTKPDYNRHYCRKIWLAKCRCTVYIHRPPKPLEAINRDSNFHFPQKSLCQSASSHQSVQPSTSSNAVVIRPAPRYTHVMPSFDPWVSTPSRFSVHHEKPCSPLAPCSASELQRL